MVWPDLARKDLLQCKLCSHRIHARERRHQCSVSVMWVTVQRRPWKLFIYVSKASPRLTTSLKQGSLKLWSMINLCV